MVARVRSKLRPISLHASKTANVVLTFVSIVRSRCSHFRQAGCSLVMSLLRRLGPRCRVPTLPPRATVNARENRLVVPVRYHAVVVREPPKQLTRPGVPFPLVCRVLGHIPQGDAGKIPPLALMVLNEPEPQLACVSHNEWLRVDFVESELTHADSAAVLVLEHQANDGRWRWRPFQGLPADRNADNALQPGVGKEGLPVFLIVELGDRRVVVGRRILRPPLGIYVGKRAAPCRKGGPAARL